MNQSELSAILDDIVASVGEILVTHYELSEGMVGDAATNTAQRTIDKLKKKTDDAKKRLADLRDRQRHKREVERRRKENERQRWSPQTESKNTGMVTLRDGAGKVVGFIRAMGPHRTDYFDRTGKFVAREVGGKTYTASGKLAAHDCQGMRVLGAASCPSVK